MIKARVHALLTMVETVAEVVAHLVSLHSSDGLALLHELGLRLLFRGHVQLWLRDEVVLVAVLHLIGEGAAVAIDPHPSLWRLRLLLVPFGRQVAARVVVVNFVHLVNPRVTEQLCFELAELVGALRVKQLFPFFFFIVI